MMIPCLLDSSLHRLPAKPFQAELISQISASIFVPPKFLNSLFAHTSRRLTQYLEFLIIINYDQCNQHQARTNCERLQTAFRNDQMLSRIIHDSRGYAAWFQQNRCPAFLQGSGLLLSLSGGLWVSWVGRGKNLFFFNARVYLENRTKAVLCLCNARILVWCVPFCRARKRWWGEGK